jgi:hypothetical protein
MDLRHLPFLTMDHQQVCQEISGELQDMARWLSGGGLSPEQFRLGLTRLEDRKLKRFGLTLNSSVSEDGVVHFSLRVADTEELCASMDVDPATGVLTVQPACQTAPENRS